MEPLPNKTLGQRLRDLRQKADLSLRDLGNKLKDPETGIHVSAAFLSDIENGRRFPSEEMFEKLAEVLSADAAELRRCDPRGPAKEMQNLATMNAQYAFAFRRAVDFVQDQKLSPEEFVRRVETNAISNEEFIRRWDSLVNQQIQSDVLGSVAESMNTPPLSKVKNEEAMRRLLALMSQPIPPDLLERIAELRVIPEPATISEVPPPTTSHGQTT
jgi:transcriptional regulator with XRE-family HTH domain